jgi:hypothetical protein
MTRQPFTRTFSKLVQPLHFVSRPSLRLSIERAFPHYFRGYRPEGSQSERSSSSLWRYHFVISTNEFNIVLHNLLASHDLRSSIQHELHFASDDGRTLVFEKRVQSKIECNLYTPEELQSAAPPGCAHALFFLFVSKSRAFTDMYAVRVYAVRDDFRRHVKLNQTSWRGPCIVIVS